MEVEEGKGKRLTTIAGSLTKIDQHDNFTRAVSVTVTVVRDRKIRTALRTNQIIGFVTVTS